MTVESTLRKVTYEGNGVATSFPVPFEFSQATDLSLVFTNAAGVDSAVTANFEVVTVSGGTSVTFPVSGSPMVSGTRLTIFRETPQTQIVALEQGGAFAPDVLEHDGFDRIVMMVQEVQEGLDRAVKVSISSDTTPDELIDNLFDSAESAAESAAQALASADNARESAQNARASEVLAAESRDWSCECAERSEAARDVAIQQTEATNVLMATELAKINTIVDANRDNQELTVEQARKWAENEHNVPVAVDDDGRPMYSARHWATEAEEINIPIMSETVHGVARVGKGLEITNVDVLGIRFPDDSELTLENTEMPPRASQLASLYFRTATLEGKFPVGIANGGTGLTAAPSLLTNLSTTAAASPLAASPRPGVTGTLPITNGGTGNNSGISPDWLYSLGNYWATSFDIGDGIDLILPSGGTWFIFFLAMPVAGWSQHTIRAFVGTVAGGTVIGPYVTGYVRHGYYRKVK